jgi:NAD-reducing hydrogenase large subunit
MKTPLAQQEFLLFKSINKGKPVHGTFYYHYARLIELIGSIEEVNVLLNDPESTSLHLHHQGKWNYNRGVGCCEAPRGILFHDYQTDATGKLLKVNLLIATGQNNPSMNRSVLDVSRQLIKKGEVNEGILNRIESSIRCYDPCLSCSTHAIGQMPMHIEVLLPNGDLWKEIHSTLE